MGLGLRHSPCGVVVAYGELADARRLCDFPLGEPRSDFSCLSFSARRYSLCSFGRSRLLISIASPFRMSDNVIKSTAIYESVTFRYEVLESVIPPPATPTR